MRMKHTIAWPLLGAVALICGIAAPVAAAIIRVEDFSEGISAAQWEIVREDAAGAPWTITAPDSDGRLRISKLADTDSLTASMHRRAWIRSRFYLIGDFSVFTDFELIEFPGTNTDGWNEALLRLGTTTNAPIEYAFMTLRFSSQGDAQYSEGFSTEPTAHPIGMNADSTVIGRLGVTRQGQTLSAWIDRGVGPVLLGSATSANFEAPMNVQLMAAQMAAGSPQVRPSTAIDVRFDNVVMEAEGIVPEPSTVILFSIGALGVAAYFAIKSLITTTGGCQ